MVYTNLNDFQTAAAQGATGEVFNLDVSGLNGQTLTLPSGNAIVINLTGNLSGGTFTVDTPSATVNNNASNGTITIDDVSGNTWNENGSGNSLLFNDTDSNTKLVIGANATVKKLTLGVDAVTPNVEIASGAVVTELAVETPGAVINNKGTVSAQSGKETPVITGTKPATGVGTTSLKLAESKTMDNLVFKVFGIKDGKSEAKLTLEQLKTAYSLASDADLKAIAQIQVDGAGTPTDVDAQAALLKTVAIKIDGITVDGGVLNIPALSTGIFSPEHFAIVKTTDSPFHISVYDKDNAGGPASENRLAKITITKNGVTFTDVNTAAINK